MKPHECIARIGFDCGVATLAAAYGFLPGIGMDTDDAPEKKPPPIFWRKPWADARQEARAQ